MQEIGQVLLCKLDIWLENLFLSLFLHGVLIMYSLVSLLSSSDQRLVFSAQDQCKGIF